MSSGAISECPRCKGTNISVKAVTLDDEVLYRVLECKDCNDAELRRTIDEIQANRPDLAERYAKVKLRTDFYGTITIKDLK